MGEPEGRTDETRDAGAGALPEGHAADGSGYDTDPSQRQRVPPLPGQPRAAGDMSLDMAAALDEPEQLVRHLVIAAQEHIGASENEAKWKVVLGHASAATKELERVNQPRSR